MSSPLDLEVSELAKAHIVAAEEWWRLNRPKAPNAIREELERAAAMARELDVLSRATMRV